MGRQILLKIYLGLEGLDKMKLKIKKAEIKIEYIMFLILGVILLFIMIYSISGIPIWLSDLFPTFFKNETDNLDLYSGSEIDNPDAIVFEFEDGTSEKNIFYNCQRNTGWKFYIDYTDYGGGSEPFRVQTWRKVSEAKDFVKYSEYTLKTQNFIFSLNEKDCEKGLQLLADRTKGNSEGGIANTAFIARVGKTQVHTFNYNDPALSDLDLVIKRLNKMTREAS